MTQPEALRLADRINSGDFSVLCLREAAAELRRLHEVNAALLEALNNVVQYEHGFCTTPEDLRDIARAAIEKAGEA